MKTIPLKTMLLNLMNLTIVALLILSSASAFAEGLPVESQELEASAQVTLRDSSPDASFGTKGEKIGFISEGDTVKVLSAKQHLTVYGFEVWVEVVSLKDPKVKGWVLDGLSGEVLKGKGKLQALSQQVLAKLDH